MEKAMIFDIQRGSAVDGPGIRTAVFFKGCNLRCAWCHNPEGLAAAPQLLFYREKCGNCGNCRAVCPNRLERCDLCGRCVKVCPNGARELCGKEYGTEELLAEILKDTPFYAASGGGVTFSGGECMLQIGFLAEIARRCKENGVSTAVDTAGNVAWEDFERILPVTDLFLYDVKCVSEDLHRRGTGVSNTRILENLRKLSARGARIRVRVPLIPGFNDTEEECGRIAAFLKTVNAEAVEVLPYHGLGERKREAAGLPPAAYPVPDAERVRRLTKILQNENP